MNESRRTLGIALLLVTVTGCTDTSTPVGQPESGRWTLTSLSPPPEAGLPADATVAFSNGSVEWYDGCNDYRQPYSHAGDHRIVVGQEWMNEGTGCLSDIRPVERALNELFSGTVEVGGSRDEMVLEGHGVRATFVPELPTTGRPSQPATAGTGG